MTCFRSAYTVYEKVVFRIVATATVSETFTYQVSQTVSTKHLFATIRPSPWCPVEVVVVLRCQIGNIRFYSQ